MGGVVIGGIPFLVLLAFAPVEIQTLGADLFDTLLSTADLSRLRSGAGMVRLYVLILITSLCPGIGLVG